MKLIKSNEEYQEKLKRDKAEQQKTYRDILATQLRLKHEIKTNYGTMNDHEIKMNIKDLYAIIFPIFFRLLKEMNRNLMR